MAKSSNQKTKLLRLSQLLLRQTDEDHPMPVAQIIEELGKYDIKAERKSIYDDLEVLGQLGMDVQCRKGRAPGWLIGEREFQLPEVKLLMDAVQSSRFLDVYKRQPGAGGRRLRRHGRAGQKGPAGHQPDDLHR